MSTDRRGFLQRLTALLAAAKVISPDSLMAAPVPEIAPNAPNGPLETTLWHPDTCKCVISLQWDRTLSLEARTHRVIGVKRCKLPHPEHVIGQLHEGSAYHKWHKQERARALKAQENA